MSGRPKYAPRRDRNDDIVKIAIEKLQAKEAVKVLDVSKIGKLVDRLLWIGNMQFAIEIKVPKAEKKLTEGEKCFPGLVFVATTVDEVYEIINYMLKLADKSNFIIKNFIDIEKGIQKYERKK